MTKTSKPQKAGKIVKKIIIALLVVILTIVAITGAYFCYLYILATDKTEAYKLETTASAEICDVLTDAVANNQMSTVVTDEQVNGLIKKIIEERISTEENADNAVVVKNIVLDTHEGNKGKFYADISFHNIDMVYSADFSYYVYEYKPLIFLDLWNSKVGKLEVPDMIILKAISESFENEEDFNFKMYSIKVPSVYTYEYEDNEVQLEIKKIIAQEKGMNKLDIEGNINAISNSKEE